MGYAKDLGTSRVVDIDPLTRYPRDRYGHLLQTTDLHDGALITDWDKTGTELPNFTSPYGHLFYATGNRDDFICYDFAEVNAGPRGLFVILHATVNSETASFIDGFDYGVMPANTTEERRAIVATAFGMVDRAREWCDDDLNPIRHSIAGWNQSDDFFAISVAQTLFPYRFWKKGPRNEYGSRPTLNVRRNNAAARKVALSIAYDPSK